MLPYTPLHHLLLADAGLPLVMTSGNVSDEPIAYRRRRRARAPGAAIADAFLVHDRPIHTRIDDSVVRAVRGRPRSCGARAATCRRRCRCRSPRGAPLLACGARAEEHVLPRARRARLGRPPHRRPRRTARRCAVLPRGRRALRGAVRRRAGASSPTTCTRTTSRRATRSSARASTSSASSTTTPISPRAWPSTAATEPRRRRDLRRHRATAATGRSGAASSCVGDLRGFERAGHLLAVRAARRRPRGARALADGVRVAGRRGAREPRPPAALRDDVERPWEAVRADGASAALGAADDQHGPAVRRRRRALRRARAVHLRGAGGDRAGGACDRRRRAAAYPLAVTDALCSTRGRRCRAVARRRSPPA